MLRDRIPRRALLAAGFAGAGVAAWSFLERLAPSGPSARTRGDPPTIYPPEGGRVELDPALMPKTFQEAPELTNLVRDGKLPPVAERIGLDPLVIAPLHGIGHYGGTLRRAFTGPSDPVTAARFAAGPASLLYWNPERTAVIPNIARAFEVSPDGRMLTLSLRRGMRWSDGAPFTADDVMFWYEDMYNDRRVIPHVIAALTMDGSPVRLERLDDVTIQFVSTNAYHLLPEVLASWGDLGGPAFAGRFGMGGFAPKHYLSRFHPRYVEEAGLKRAAREAGFANWSIQLKSLNDWTLNRELPVVSPWRMVEPVNTQVFALERNPYSVWVDSAGNQLPYIDRIRHTFCSGPDAVSFKAGAGGLDAQDRHLSVAKLPFLLSNRGRSGYDVHIDPYEGTDLAIRVNLDYQLDGEIGGLLAMRDFRRALSMGLDRAAINDTLLFGAGHPSSSVPLATSRYYPGREWADRWANLDLEAANRLLDRIGLKARDSAGFRLRRDGRGRLRLTCQTAVMFFDYPAVGEMVREQWRAIGIDLDLQIVEGSLFAARCAAGEVQLAVHYAATDDPFLGPDFLFPSNPSGTMALMGPDYARWFQSSGAAGKRPPPDIEVMTELWRRGREAQLEERVRIGQEMIRRHVDEVMSIGLVSGGPSVYGVRIANRELGNVPRRVVNTEAVSSPANGLPMTFYFRNSARLTPPGKLL